MKKCLITFLIVLFLGGSIVLSEDKKKPVTLDDVKAWEEFSKAKLTELKVYKVPMPVLKKNVSIPLKKSSEKLEAEITELAEKLNLPRLNIFKWTSFGDSISVTIKGEDNFFMSCSLEPKTMKLNHIYFKLSKPPRDGLSKVNGRQFLKYASRLYIDAFGVEPLGEPQFYWGGDGMKLSQSESVFWWVKVEGVSLVKRSSVQIVKNKKDLWNITIGRGVNKKEVAAVKKIINKNSIKISHREAMAIALKNWKAIGSAPKGKKPINITSNCKQIYLNEAVGGNYVDFQKFWINPNYILSDKAIYAYEVIIQRNLFFVQVIVDLNNGSVIYMEQGKMGW